MREVLGNLPFLSAAGLFMAFLLTGLVSATFRRRRMRTLVRQEVPEEAPVEPKGFDPSVLARDFAEEESEEEPAEAVETGSEWEVPQEGGLFFDGDSVEETTDATIDLVEMAMEEAAEEVAMEEVAGRPSTIPRPSPALPKYTREQVVSRTPVPKEEKEEEAPPEKTAVQEDPEMFSPAYRFSFIAAGIFMKSLVPTLTAIKTGSEVTFGFPDLIVSLIVSVVFALILYVKIKDQVDKAVKGMKYDDLMLASLYFSTGYTAETLIKDISPFLQ